MGNVLDRMTRPSPRSRSRPASLSSPTHTEDVHVQPAEYPPLEPAPAPAPILQPTIPAPLQDPSQEIVDATERGMIGGCLLPSGILTTSSSNISVPDSRRESGLQGPAEVLDEDSESEGRELEDGGRWKWDGLGEDGERHVRWKGLHA